MFLFTSAWSYFDRSGFNHRFWIDVIVGVFTWPLAGYALGAWVWRSGERQFCRGEQTRG
jgi:hypothetical protein